MGFLHSLRKFFNLTSEGKNSAGKSPNTLNPAKEAEGARRPCQAASSSASTRSRSGRSVSRSSATSDNSGSDGFLMGLMLGSQNTGSPSGNNCASEWGGGGGGFDGGSCGGGDGGGGGGGGEITADPAADTRRYGRLEM